MVTHKIQDEDNDKTVCGLDIWKNEIEASIYWEDVDCKRCLAYKENETKKVGL